MPGQTGLFERGGVYRSAGDDIGGMRSPNTLGAHGHPTIREIGDPEAMFGGAGEPVSAD
jgi:hypothetical protein